MPVGGRINRRDNLRSKKVLSKAKPTKDINAKSTKETPSDLSNLDILKPKETKISDKSEVIIENLRDYYVRLEDLKLNKINDNEDNNESKSKTVNVTLSVTNASVLDTPRKRGRAPKKKDEPEAMEVEEVKPQVLINESVSDTPRKRGRQPKKKEVSEIFESITETGNSVSVIENELIPVKATGKKGRLLKKVEDILEINEGVKETVEVDLEKKMLGRRNAFQRAVKESNNVEEIVEEKVEEVQAKGRNKANHVMVSVLDNTDKNELDPTVVVNNTGDAMEVECEPQVTKPRVRNARGNEEHDKVETTVRRTKSKLSKQQKPFVIEKEEGGEAAQVKQTKIPGLVMLDNIKSRKSELLSMKAKETVQEENMAKKPPVAPKKTEKSKPVEPIVDQIAVQEKVPGLKMTADIKRRKSELLGHLNDETPNLSRLPSVRQSISSVSVKQKTEIVENGKEIRKIESKVSVLEPKKKEASESTKEIQKTEVVSVKDIKKCVDVVAPVKESKIPEVILSANETDKQTNNRKRVSIFSSTPKKSSGKEEIKSTTPVPSAKIQSKITSSSPVVSKEKIPGLSMMKTGSFKRTNIDSPMPQTVKKSRISAALPVSDKVPGLSTTDQIRKQKIDVQVQKEEQKKQEEHKRREDDLKKKADEQKRIIDEQKRQLEAQRQELEQEKKKKEEQRKADSFQKMFTNEYKRVSAAINPSTNVVNTSRLSMSSSLLKSPSVKVPTVSILAKPSPYKRPMSCLDDPEDEDDIVENRPKVSRVQQERRQSVTFNREVEVKEIHGNSFNSDASMTSVNNEDDFEKRVQEELERTKHRMADKRFGFNKSVNISFSTDSSVPTFTKPEVRPLTKKTSNLSELITTRVKVHSPPRISISSRPMSSQQQNPVQSSGALRKLASQGPSVSSSDWKSFRPSSADCGTNDNSNEQLNSSQMSNDEDDTSNKGKCSIM